MNPTTYSIELSPAVEVALCLFFPFVLVWTIDTTIQWFENTRKKK